MRLVPDCRPDPLTGNCGFYRVGEACPAGQVCLDGGCAPVCTIEVRCPTELAPACADDGLVYWNECYRDLAGKAAASDCSLSSLGRVWSTPGPSYGVAVIPGDPPTLLTTEDWDDTGEFWPMAAFRASRDWSTVVPVWRRQDGVGLSLEALPAGDGRVILFAARAQRIYAAAATHEGLEAIILNLPRGTYSLPISSAQGAVEHLVWTPQWLLSFDPLAPSGPAIANSEPTSGGEDSGPSAFGLMDDGSTALVTGREINRITIWRVEREAPRLRYLWRGGLPGGIQGVGLARSPAGTVLVASGADGDMAFTTTTSHLRAWRWDGSCMTELLQAEFDVPKSQFGDVTAGDLDGDGIDEIAWGQGERVYVLGFDEQGLPVIRAELRQSGGNALRLKILDGNGDGINELWTIIEDSPAYGPPNPTSAWMLGPPEPLTCASDADCGEDLPFCGPAARCGDCLVDADCDFGATCAEAEGRLLCRP